MKHRANAPTYMAIIFIFSLGIMLAIYTSSGNQFQSIKSGTTPTSLYNAQIGQNVVQQSSQYQVNFASTITTTINGFTTTLTTFISPDCTANANNQLAQAYCSIINFQNALGAAFCNAVNSIPILNQGCQPSTAPNSANNILAAQQLIGGIVGSNVNSATNNSILTTLSDPFAQAMIALSTFLALGILAGVLGAGMLARVMMLAGLALSVILYIEGQLAAFAGMPTFIWWIFNGIMTAVMIIIIHEAFSKGGIG